MSKPRNSKSIVRPEAPPESPPASSPIALTDEEQWSTSDEIQTIQDILEDAGLTYLGPVDAPDPEPPLTVPAPIFRLIQQYDREAGAAIRHRQEYMDLAVEMLGIDTVTYYPTIDFDTGTVTLQKRSEMSA